LVARGSNPRRVADYFENFKFALIVAFAAPTLVFVASVLLLKAHTIFPAAVVCLMVWFFITQSISHKLDFSSTTFFKKMKIILVARRAA
jgi:hypothetical protein